MNASTLLARSSSATHASRELTWSERRNHGVPGSPCCTCTLVPSFQCAQRSVAGTVCGSRGLSSASTFSTAARRPVSPNSTTQAGCSDDPSNTRYFGRVV